jgi:hypothetical protein
MYNHTPSGTSSQRLNGSSGSQVGVTKSFAVAPGDTVKIESNTDPSGLMVDYAHSMENPEYVYMINSQLPSHVNDAFFESIEESAWPHGGTSATANGMTGDGYGSPTGMSLIDNDSFFDFYARAMYGNDVKGGTWRNGQSKYYGSNDEAFNDLGYWESNNENISTLRGTLNWENNATGEVIATGKRDKFVFDDQTKEAFISFFCNPLGKLPSRNANGTPAHPSIDSYTNQCAIRMGSTLMNSGVDMSHYKDKYNVTSDGYPRGSQELANWLYENFGPPTDIVTQDEFVNKIYPNKTGIMFIMDTTRSYIPHIDLFNQGTPGSGIYGGASFWYWEIK